LSLRISKPRRILNFKNLLDIDDRRADCIHLFSEGNYISTCLWKRTENLKRVWRVTKCVTIAGLKKRETRSAFLVCLARKRGP
jgi:hypothetical protein